MAGPHDEAPTARKIVESEQNVSTS